MTARSEALQLRQWAEASGVFSQGRSAGTQDLRDRLGAGEMFSASAELALTRKPITAIGFAAPEKEEPKVFIYTRRKLTVAEMRSMKDSSPVKAKLEFRVAQPFSVTLPTSAAALPLNLRSNRITCGGSISVGNNREAGTLGALLRDKDGTLYGLSCNHVTGGCSNARVGLPIVAPGILDIGAGLPDPRTIGQHARTLQFIPGDPSAITGYKANRDVAVFKISDPNAHSSFQGSAYDTPAAVGDPEEDGSVQKVGRTTGHTLGIIESQLVGSQRIDYKMTAYHSAEENSSFQGSVFFEPVFIIRGTAGSFAAEGDSGALVVTRSVDEDPVAVGIVIGGDRANDVTYMLPLKPVLDALRLELVSEYN
ncbi:hypothetical protein NFO65_00190 [Neorhizobium galegae]|uniref:hypothetical protein n=1 Tax=Neorhizobium galegae TaxID=399 RepID=UPI0021018D7B|nr:hypothetical protein [Neorhizobium galegae]MCQ1569156.1 hypothetical protein [Neorhizobium galegae]